MNRKILISAIAAMSLTLAASAFAQGNRDDHGRNDRGRDEHSQRDDRGAGPNHSYHKGDRLSAREHRKQYVVNDWRSHDLRAPPRGYHWVQSGSDFVLAAIATGIIADIFLSR